MGDGHKTKAPSSIAYSNVISKDSVWSDLTISDLNYIEVCVCNICKFKLKF